MSLLDAYSTEFILMERVRLPDGAGGKIPSWSEGIHFDGALTLDTSIQAQIAQSQTTSRAYTLTTARSMSLEYHDAFKRVEDGAIFRVTSEEGDSKTPSLTALDMSQCKVERWELTK